jgi:flavin-dependent dehydrogenase
LKHSELETEKAIHGKRAEAIAAGGGLAGAAFALELARHGRDAVIFERMPGAHHKVCGEFLSDRAQALLRYLGIDIDELPAGSIETLSLSNGARCADAPLPFKAAAISRILLDETLLKAAAGNGARVFYGTTVEALECTSRGSVHVRTNQGTLICGAAALASGKHNVRGLARPNGTMLGFKIHLVPSDSLRADLTGVVRLVAFTGGYLGLCLIEHGILSMAWTIREEILRAIGSSWHDQASYFTEQSPFFGDVLNGAQPIWNKPLAVSGLPYGFMRSEPIAPAIYPVGDQLAVIPSFVGDGTALALASGIAAAQAVLQGKSAIAFQRDMIALYRPQFRRAAALDMVVGNAALRRVGIAGAQLFPSVMTMLVSATRSRGIDDLMAFRRSN